MSQPAVEAPLGESPYEPRRGSPYRPPEDEGGTHGCLGALVASLVALVGTVLVVLLIVALGLALVGGIRSRVRNFQEHQDRQHADAQDDAAAPACSVNASGDLHAEVRVTNDSSKRSRYAVTVAFRDAGGEQLDSSFGLASKVDPGESAVVRIDTLTKAPDGPFTCEVTDVRRLADTVGN